MKTKLLSRVTRFLVAFSVAIGSAAAFNSPVVLAAGEPTVTWTTPNGSTFAGTATIEATASATSGDIKKWCVTKDGVALTANSAVSSMLTYYYSEFSASTGCWSNASYSLTTGKLSFDTTAWADGSHTYQITVTDSSNRTATSTVLTVNNVNTGPSVSWVTTNGSTFAGTATIEATAAAASTGSAYIKKWCVTKDGVALTTDVGRFSSLTSLYATFSASTGCWSVSSGSSAVSSGTLSFDTTAWADGSYAYQIMVTDSSDRTATSTVLTIKTVNPRPTIALVGVTAGASLSGTLSISLNVTMPNGVTGLTVKSYCYKIDGLACVGSSSGFSLDTSMLKNGSHSIAVSIVDSAGRTVSLPEVLFTTSNSGAALMKVGRKFTTPSWSNKSVKINISVTSARSTQVKAKYGLSATSLNRTGWLDPDGGSITGLKPNTKYYFSVEAIGVNGNSKTSKFSIISPKIPSKPRSSGSSGGSGGSSYPRVIGWRLDQAMSASSAFYYRQYSSCYRYSGFENGGLGVWDESNWVVVDQSGSLLYVCKRK